MIDVILRLRMSADDFDLLDEVAQQAGKTRDEFARDFLNQMIWMERRVRDRDRRGGAA